MKIFQKNNKRGWFFKSNKRTTKKNKKDLKTVINISENTSLSIFLKRLRRQRFYFDSS